MRATPESGARPVGRHPGWAFGYIIDATTLFCDCGTPSQGNTGGNSGPPGAEPQRPKPRRVAETWESDDVDPTVLQRLACDADLYAILLKQLGMPTAVGRTKRTATREQRLQLRALYDKCPLDRTTPFARCEIHHVNVLFEDGGHTEIDNLVPISPKWHHLIHDRNWTLKMGPDRELRVWRPDGTPHRIIPPPTPTTRQTE